MTRPMGKYVALRVRRRPGALVWNQGEASVERTTAQPKPRRGPVRKLLTKSLSRRVVAFLVPMRAQSSVVCWGVNASIVVFGYGRRCLVDGGGGGSSLIIRELLRWEGFFWDGEGESDKRPRSCL